MVPNERLADFPDGVERRHLEPDHWARPHVSLLSLGLLGAVLALGLSGYAGDRHADHAIDNAAGRFELRVPSIVRNGNVIETRAHVVAHQRIGKLVIAIEPSLWRQITTNSTEPVAGAERSADGLLRFEYDALEAGKDFELQIAQQVNPSLFGINRGRIVFLDGERPLAEIALAITVLP